MMSALHEAIGSKFAPNAAFIPSNVFVTSGNGRGNAASGIPTLSRAKRSKVAMAATLATH